MRKSLFATIIAAIALPICTYGQTEVISTIAGAFNSGGYSGDGGPASAAIIYSPSDITFDHAGNLYFTDFLNNVIRKIDTGGIITTVAGTGYGAGATAGGAYTGDGGPALSADLNGPFALAIDHSGNIIFADGYNHVVRKVSTSGIITTIAGQNATGYTGDGGAATAAKLNNPVGIAIDRFDNIYIADDHNNAIRMVNSAGIITTFAGTSVAGYTGDGGAASVATLSDPIGVCVDTAGNLYIADADNGVVRKVNTLGIISTFAGRTDTGYSGDGGPATAARLRSPQRVNIDAANNVYISDFYNNVVRKVDAAGIISTYAGDGTGAGTGGTTGAYGGDGGPATAAQLTLPDGVAFDSSGRTYICDRGNQLLRRIGPAPVVDTTVDTTTNHTAVSQVNKAAAWLTIYPNPAYDGSFAINLAATITEPAEVVIVNLEGAVLKRFTTTTNNPVSIKQELPAGIYIVTATTTRGKWTKPVVVE